MKIVFYFEPFLDKSLVFCGFFENYFKGLISQFVINLKKYTDTNNIDIKIQIIASEYLYNYAKKKESFDFDIQFINHSKLCSIFKSYQNYIKLKKLNPSADEFKLLSEIIRDKIGNIEPDIFFGCSVNIGFLEKFFPNSSILYNESGLFGYLEYFKHTLYLDLIQNNKSCLLNKKVGENVYEEEQYNQNKDQLNNYLINLSKLSPLSNIFNVNKYKKIGLLALQRWDSELMQLNTDFECELDYINNILENVSSEFGLIITMHKTSSIIADKNTYELLKAKFPNITLIADSSLTPSINLIYNCDFIITNSSTTAFYALFLNKKILLTSSNSYLNPIANCNNVAKFNQEIVSKNEKNLENYKKFFLQNYFIPAENFFNGEWLYNFLKNIILNKDSISLNDIYKANNKNLEINLSKNKNKNLIKRYLKIIKKKINSIIILNEKKN